MGKNPKISHAAAQSSVYVTELEQSLESARLEIADLEADRYRLATAVDKMRRELVSAAAELEQAHKDRQALISYQQRRPLALMRRFALALVLPAIALARRTVRRRRKSAAASRP